MFRALKLIDVATGAEQAAYLAKDARPVAFSPDGKLLATALYTGEECFSGTWRRGSEVVLAEHKGLIFCVDFAPDGKRLATACEDGSVKITGPPPQRRAILSRAPPRRRKTRQRQSP